MPANSSCFNYLASPRQMPTSSSCFQYPLSCFSYQPHMPRSMPFMCFGYPPARPAGIGHRDDVPSAPPGLRQMPGTITCFRY